jgi:hypothetical protein
MPLDAFSSRKNKTDFSSETKTRRVKDRQSKAGDRNGDDDDDGGGDGSIKPIRGGREEMAMPTIRCRRFDDNDTDDDDDDDNDYMALAPATISRISPVILACRWRL